MEDGRSVSAIAHAGQRQRGVAADPAIDISAVSLRFETNDGPVRRSASRLSVARGEFVSLIGPSGCGKTTLLRVIADLEKPTAGAIRVNGMSPQRGARSSAPMAMSSRRRRSIRGARRAQRRAAAGDHGLRQGRARAGGSHANLELVNLTGFERKFPWQLSGGMQQRASIARALSFEPELLLMDEPFGALDEIVRDILNEQLLALWAKTNKTVLFVTHSIPEAVFLSTRIVVMSPRPGKIYDVIECNFPRDRTLDIRETPEFLKIAHRVRRGLREGHSYDG